MGFNKRYLPELESLKEIREKINSETCIYTDQT